MKLHRTFLAILVPVILILSAGGTAWSAPIAPTFVTAGEMAGFNLVYAVDNGQFDFNDAYTVDNSASFADGSFTRVGYFVQLDSKWAWVSMDTFNVSAAMLGVPKAGTGIVENGTLVSNLVVETSAASGVTAGTFASGIIEFWSSNYSQNGGGLYGSDDGRFDWKDSGGSSGSGHGSFQVFSLNAAQTLGETVFAISANGGAGIGDQYGPGGGNAPDWTFGPGTGTYTTRNLEIWVFTFVPDTLTWDGVANGNFNSATQWVGGAPGATPTDTATANIGPNGTLNTVTVTANGTAYQLNITSNGGLIVGAGNTLDIVQALNATGRPITLNGGATLNTESGDIGTLTTTGSATVGNSAGLSVDTVVLVGSNTFNKTGSGTLDIVGTSNTIPATAAARVSGGELKMQGAGNPLGGATLELNGGTFTVEGLVGDKPNALIHYGYHINNDNLALNLDGNGGMMGGGDPTTGPSYYGSALLTNGPGNRGLDFNNDADFRNTGAINQNDNYSNLFVGLLNVSAANAGNWEFRRVNDDDRMGIWLDYINDNGTFESSTPGLGSNRGEQLQWDNDGGVKTVTLAAGDYLFAVTHREGGSGSGVEVEFKTPLMGSRTVINPGDPAQAGIWSAPDKGLAAVGMATSSVKVRDDSTLNVLTDTTADFAGLSYEIDNKTLTITDAAGSMSFTGTTFVSGITNAGIVTEASTNLGPISDAGVVGPLTITKTGSSELTLDSSSTSLAATTTLAVSEGRLSADYTTGNPSGSAKYLLSGGTLAVNANGLDLQTLLTVDNLLVVNQLDHHGYHTGPNGVMDLDNNGGMMGSGDPTQGPTYYGSALLTTGPGNRGLDFDSDTDFLNTGAIGQVDNYSNLWVGLLTVSAANVGNWEFRNNGDDDRAGIWIDLNCNGVFESSTAGLGSNRGEQLSWEDTGTKTVSLDEGEYLIAFTHSEGGGGSRADFRFKSPTMGGQAIVKPGDAAQAGLWSLSIRSTLELTDTAASNLQNLVMKHGDLRITGGSLLTVEQASISTATSGLVALIIETPTILTDVSGLNGNNQTVTIYKKGASDLVLNKAGANLGAATLVAKAGRLIGVSGGTNPFGSASLAVRGGEVVLASNSGTARTYDNALEVLGDGTLTAGAGDQGGNNASVTLGSAGNGITLTGGTLTARTQDGYSLTILGAISGAGGLNVQSDVTVAKALSAGTLDLSATLTRSGGTAGDQAITAGDLFLRNAAGSLAIASGETLTVNTSGLVEGGATLRLDGTMAGAGTVAIDTGSTFFGTSATNTAPVTIQSGGVIAPGGGTLGTTLDSLSTGTLTVDDGGIYNWQLGATGDAINVAGNLTLTDNWTLHLIDATAPLTLGDQLLFSYTGTGTVGTVNFDLSGLPASWQTAGIEIFHDVAGKKVYLRNLVVTGPAAGDLTWDGTDNAESEWRFGSGVDSHWDGGAVGAIPTQVLTATVNSGRVEVSVGDGAAHTLTVATAGEVEITSARTLAITESTHINSGGLVTVTDGTLASSVDVNVNAGGTLDVAANGVVQAIQLNNSGTSNLQVGASGNLVKLNVDAGTTTLNTASVSIGDTTVTGGALNLGTDVPMTNLNVTGGQVVAGANHAIVGDTATLSSADYSISSGQTFGAGGTTDSSKADRLNLTGGTLTIDPPGGELHTGGLNAWFDASDLAGSYSNGQNVGLWTDKSGNGHDATRETGNLTFTTNQVNGLPVVSLSGNGNASLAGTLFSKEQYIVFKNRNGNNVFDNWGAVLGDVTAQEGYMMGNNGGAFWGGNLPEAVSTNGNVVPSPFYINDMAGGDYLVMKIIGEYAGTTDREYWIGSVYGNGSNQYHTTNLDIAEIMSFDHELNAVEENSVGFYLANKYGVATSYTDPNPAMDLSATTVNVEQNTALNVMASTVDFASLTLQSGILTTQGASGGMTFSDTTIAGAAVGIATDVNTSSGAIDGGGQGATFVKSGTADLLVQGAGSNLAGTTFDVQDGRLIGVYASNPFGAATLQISGGEAVLSSASDDVSYDNPVTVTAGGSLTLGAGGAGAAGPLELTLGNAGSGIALNAGTLTVETTDSYNLIVPGTIAGAGNIDIVGGSVQTDQGISAAVVGIANTTLETSGNITATGDLTLFGGSITSAGTVTISSTTGNVSVSGTPNLTITGGHLTTFGEDVLGSLTYDFESGDLTGWTDVGTSFGPDNLFNNGNNPVNHSRMAGEQGSWYIDGYRTQAGSNGDGHSGILESDSFTLGAGATISLLIGGGNAGWSGDPDSPVANLKGIGVERQVAPGDWENIHWETSTNSNTFQARSWDASAYAGETLRVRIYDTHTGGWGWTALDNLQVSSTRDLTVYGALSMVAGSQLSLDDGTGPGNGSASFLSITTGDGATINGQVIATGSVTIGDSPGTLNVVGNYTQGAGSTYRWEIDGAASDLIAATGTIDATADWKLEITPLAPGLTINGTILMTGSAPPAAPGTVTVTLAGFYSSLYTLNTPTVSVSGNSLIITGVDPVPLSISQANANWDVPSTWENNTVPTGAAALIDGETVTVANAGASAAIVTVSAGTLDVQQDLTIATTVQVGGSGTLLVTAPGSVTSTSGEILISSGGTLHLASGATVTANNIDLGSGAMLTSNGTQTMPDNVSLDPLSTIHVASGTLSVNASIMPYGLEAWFDASTGVTVDGSDDVTTWADQSSNGRDAVTFQGTGRLTAGEVNGLPAVLFGENESLEVTGSEFFSHDTYLVFRSDSGNGVFGPNGGGWGSPFGPKDNGNDNHRSWMFDGGEDRFWNGEPPGAVNWNGYAISSANTFDMSAVAGSHGSDMSDYMVLKVTAGTANNLGVVRAYTLGTRNDEWSNLKFATAEVMAFNRALTADEENAVGGYLAAKYGITAPNYTSTASFVEYGNLQVETGATLQNSGGGISVAELSGGGTIVSNTIVRSMLAPGDTSTGTLTVTGDVTIDPGVTWVSEIDNGQTPRNDALAVSGSLNITGVTLDVPAAGSKNGIYVIASYGSLTGTFASINMPAEATIDYNYLGGKQIVITLLTTTVFRFR